MSRPSHRRSAFHHGLHVIVAVLLTAAGINAGALVMQGVFQGQVTTLYAEGTEPAAALAALGVQAGDPVTVRIQYESSQTTDHYPDLTHYGQYWWNPATELNWMETVIGQHVWLSGPDGYVVAGTVNDFEYKDSGIFMDSLNLGAGGTFLLFPGNWGCDPLHCLLSTGLDFEEGNEAPTLMASDFLPESTFLFPPELMRHEGDITIEGTGYGGRLTIRYEIDLSTALMGPAPVPAPAPIALIGLGLAGILLARPRKR